MLIQQTDTEIKSGFTGFQVELEGVLTSLPETREPSLDNGVPEGSGHPN